MTVEICAYFFFGTEGYPVWPSTEVSLSKNNIEERLQQLSKGENIFEVIPELGKNPFNKSRINPSYFAQRKEAVIDGKRYVPQDRKFLQKGPLLIPSYMVVSRKELNALIDEKDEPFEFPVLRYIDTLRRYSATQFVIKFASHCMPFDAEKMLILNEEQLRAKKAK